MLKSWNEMRGLDISKYVKQRDKADYLPWASCLKLLYDNGAEKVLLEPWKDSLRIRDRDRGQSGM